MTIQSIVAAPAWLVLLLAASLKVSLVVASVWLVTRALRTVSAAGRHLAWTVALAAALLLPAITPFVPAWSVPVPLPSFVDVASPEALPARPAVEEWAVITTVEPTYDTPASTVALVESAALSGAGSVAFEPPGPPAVEYPYGGNAGDEGVSGAGSGSNWPAAILVLLYVTGSILAFLPWLLGMLGVRHRERRSRAVRSPAVLSMFDAIAGEMGLRRRIRLIEGPAGTIPMTWGMIRPVVLLPEDAVTWSDTRLRAVLLHELAHIARHDASTQLLGEIACAIHWFNPMVWLAAARQRAEQERACDDLVLEFGEDAADYAAELVSLARGLRTARPAPVPAMAITTGGTLRDRLVAVLDHARNRASVSRGQVFRATFLGLITMLPLACLTPARRSVAETVPEVVTVPAVVEEAEVTSAPAAAPSPARTAPAVVRPEPVAAPPSTPAAVPAPRAEGRPVQAVSPPAQVVSPVEPAVPAAAPVAEVLPERRTVEAPLPAPAAPGQSRPASAVAAPEPRAEEVRGVRASPAVLPSRERPPVVTRAEVVPETPPAASVQRVRATPAQAADPALVVSVLNHAAARSLSDREMGNLLETAVQVGSLQHAAVRSAYIDAAATIGGDRDRADALEAVLVSGLAGPRDVVAVLDVAATINSDSRLSALLLTILERTAITAELRAPFLRALESVGSERERNRVSAELIRRGG